MKEEIYGEHEESEAKKQEIAKMYNKIIKFSQGNTPPNKLDLLFLFFYLVSILLKSNMILHFTSRILILIFVIEC